MMGGWRDDESKYNLMIENTVNDGESRRRSMFASASLLPAPLLRNNVSDNETEVTLIPEVQNERYASRIGCTRASGGPGMAVFSRPRERLSSSRQLLSSLTRQPTSANQRRPCV